MVGSRHTLGASFVLAAVAGVVQVARGDAYFADQWSNYTPGADNGGYLDPTAAQGKPSEDTGFGILTPFNAPFLGSHLVAIGAGGTLTLHLPKTAAAVGNSIGIHAGVGLIDNDYPNGNAGAVATAYTNARVARVHVSQDGQEWADLGMVTFDAPTNFYAEGVTTPGFQETPGTAEANWGKAFTQPLSSFDGKDWTGMLQVLAGSAGGNWPAITAPFAGINYIRFDVPANAAHPMFVDAVVGNTENVVINSNRVVNLANPLGESADGTIFTNHAVVDVQSDGVPLGSSSASAFINAGTLRKSGSSGSTTFAGAVSSDSGTFDIQSGTLAITGKFVSTTDSHTVKTGGGVLTISGPQSHAGGAEFTAVAGTTNFNTEAGRLGIIAQSTVNLNAPQHLALLHIAAGVTATVAPSGSNILSTDSLSLAATGRLDLNDNNLLVSYVGSSSFGRIRSLVVDGYSDQPDPLRKGIVSTTSQNTGGAKILALFDNAMVGLSEFEGEPITGDTVVGKYTFFGDLNFDGQVTGDDYSFIDANLDSTPEPGLARLRGDANLDGRTSGDDYSFIDANLGAGSTAVAAAAVPEPACWSLALAAIAVAVRRRRRA